MKKIILGTTILAASVGFAKETIPGTAGSFVEINPYKTPIVTNAEEAVYAAMSPIGTDVVMPTNEPYQGTICCYPKRMNVITNSVEDLMDLDEGLVCTFISNYRTGEIYFGPEYREMIIDPVEHAITIKPDGILFNGSTNSILVTKVPAIIKTTQFLGSNIWVTVEYPEYSYQTITLDGISTNSDGVITIEGTNLASIDNLTSNDKKMKYIVSDSTATNDCTFTLFTDDAGKTVLTNSVVAKSSAWTAGKKFTFIATTAKKAYYVKYETKEISYQIPALMSAKPIIIRDEIAVEEKKEDTESEETGFFGSIWKFFTDLF